MYNYFSEGNQSITTSPCALERILMKMEIMNLYTRTCFKIKRCTVIIPNNKTLVLFHRVEWSLYFNNGGGGTIFSVQKSVKKVRILNAKRAANCSTKNPAFCWRKNSIKRTFQNEKMEAPSLIRFISNHPRRGFLYSLLLG